MNPRSCERFALKIAASRKIQGNDIFIMIMKRRQRVFYEWTQCADIGLRNCSSVSRFLGEAGDEFTGLSARDKDKKGRCLAKPEDLSLLFTWRNEYNPARCAMCNYVMKIKDDGKLICERFYSYRVQVQFRVVWRTRPSWNARNLGKWKGMFGSDGNAMNNESWINNDWWKYNGKTRTRSYIEVAGLVWTVRSCTGAKKDRDRINMAMKMIEWIESWNL